MPNIESAIKRMRQDRKRRQANRSKRSRMRTEIKKFRSLVAEQKVDEARAMLPSLFSVIDKTAQKGVIHANTAARYKSRLAKSIE
jgi:small subunit ribosomal protein S20